MSKDAKDLVKIRKCEELLAVCNSPIFETEVKGGAYSVTLHLCRRAIAGAIARGLSLHKRSRLHFVRGFESWVHISTNIDRIDLGDGPIENLLPVVGPGDNKKKD